MQKRTLVKNVRTHQILKYMAETVYARSLQVGQQTQFAVVVLGRLAELGTTGSAVRRPDA